MKRLLCCAVLLFLLAGVASATSLTFNLYNVTFNDGGKATGSFTLSDFKSGLSQLTALDITTSGGNTALFPETHYGLNPSCVTLQGLSIGMWFYGPGLCAVTIGDPMFGFRLAYPESFPVVGGVQYNFAVGVGGQMYYELDDPIRYIASGYIKSTDVGVLNAVPEPGSLALCFPALLPALAGLIRRCRRT